MCPRGHCWVQMGPTSCFPPGLGEEGTPTPGPCLSPPAQSDSGTLFSAKLALPREHRKTTGDGAGPTSIFNVSCPCRAVPFPAATSLCGHRTRLTSLEKGQF